MPANATLQALPASWGTTVGLTSGPCLPANPSRQALIFVNSSTGVNVAICPAQLNTGLLGVYSGFQASVASINSPGSITMAPGDKFIIDSLNCTAAWNAVASGAGGQLTILES
jgi:hypothetical protein